jgi:tetratricopeptide (TPR) repeat protein
MLRNLKSLLAALALLLAPAIAHAEEPTKSYPDCGREPTEAEVQAAKGAFQAGNASFNEADYARAIDYWEDAYRRDCTANPLLLNLARAYELAGRKRQAVVSLETFLTREPSSGEKDQINRRVEVLKKKIAEEDAAAAAAPPPPVSAGAPITEPVAGPVEPVHSPQARRSPWPWVVMGVGAVATTVGAVGYFKAKSKADDLAQQCANPARRLGCPANVYDEGTSENDKMVTSSVVAGIGGACIVGGAIWWFLDKRSVEQTNASGASKRPQLLPLVAPQLAGLSVSGAF